MVGVDESTPSTPHLVQWQHRSYAAAAPPHEHATTGWESATLLEIKQSLESLKFNNAWGIEKNSLASSTQQVCLVLRRILDHNLITAALITTLITTLITAPITAHITKVYSSIYSSMAPSATEPLPIDSRIKDFVTQKKDTLPLPATARARLEKAGIDLSNGYPERPAKPLFLDDATEIRNVDREHIDAGARADKSKSALLGAAKEVIHLTRHIGTEIVGLQLKDLTDQQRDELALLIAERSVVFFRDQDITPQQQKALGEHFGEVEIHVSFVQDTLTGKLSVN
jgi:hypothetical protein